MISEKISIKSGMKENFLHTLWLTTHGTTHINDYFIRMFIKDPKHRPTASQLLETPYIIKHLEVSFIRRIILNKTKIFFSII